MGDINKYDIWEEGYLISGMEGIPSKAVKIASKINALSFEDACAIFSIIDKAAGYGKFDRKRLTFWGCRLFDNETDVRKSFG